MTNNGKKNRLVLRVEMDEKGNMPVTLGGCHESLLTYGLKLADLAIENKIIENQIKPKSDVVLPDRFVT